jgi:uncharacterized beta-barrel protein YwiB (DUF1934 family)
VENANVTFRIKQTADGETDTSELFTKAEYREHGGSYYIDYDESAATGFEGSHVQLRIDSEVMVMTRTGNAFSSFVFEKGKRHFCPYGTDYGDCMVGISTTDLKNDLDAKGGEIFVRYTVDINSGLMTTNEIKLKVKAFD